jgi:uncharacterized protein (DUF1330 family)
MGTKVIGAFRVTDYDQWYPVFKEQGVAVRRKHGATGHIVNRGIEDPNQVVVVVEFSSPEEARAFMTDPALREVMQKAGVEGAPTMNLVEEAEEERY